jgi:hypothetical protein
MAFKMKNPSMAKLAKMAGSNRVAMKMKMEEKAAAKMKREAAMKLKKESMAKQKINPFAQQFETNVEDHPFVAAPKKSKKSFEQAYKDRDMKIYGDLTFDEYKAEAKRQIESKKQGKGFDAPKKPMVSESKKNQSTTTTTTTTDTKKDDAVKKDPANESAKSKTTTKKKKGKFLKDTKVGKEVKRFGQKLKDLLTKKKRFTTDPITGKRKEYTPAKMKKAPAKMKKASMAKLNPGFDKLPKKVQAKILKKKKK